MGGWSQCALCFCVEVSEVVNATVEVGVGALEGGVGIGWHGVGN
jgi:hypothetical protein